MSTVPVWARIFVFTMALAGCQWAMGRERSRHMARSPHAGAVESARSNARFQSQRARHWQADAHGNASMHRQGSMRGYRGGSGSYQASRQRDEAGNASRQRSVSLHGPDGAGVDRSGTASRGADGSVSAGRATTVTTRDGGHYAGSLVLADGRISYSGSCSDANGNPAPCRTR